MTLTTFRHDGQTFVIFWDAESGKAACEQVLRWLDGDLVCQRVARAVVESIQAEMIKVNHECKGK